MKQVTMALCGAGLRGQYAYAPYALKYPHEVKFVAVAEPDEALREKFAKDYGVEAEQVFHTWQEMLEKPAMADALLICTMDNDHVEPALQALKMGYRHILLEKPIDKDVGLCKELAEAAKACGANVQVCHSLRYTKFYRKLKEILDSGRLGRIMNISHVEGVGYYHQAHSFVRGNWGKSAETSPMILQKCCHDMDLFLYLTGKDCLKVSSFGALSYFKEECAPEGSADRCIDCGVRDGCPYSAVAIYGPGGHWDSVKNLNKEGFETRFDMFVHGRLGRCAFRCGNDVVDHQVINLLFEDEMTVSMTMSAFAHKIGRETRIMCTLGEIYADLEASTIEIHEFLSDNVERVEVTFGASGHSGADELMVKDFRESVIGVKGAVSEIGVSVRSHEMAMAAEEARLTGKVVTLS